MLGLDAPRWLVVVPLALGGACTPPASGNDAGDDSSGAAPSSSSSTPSSESTNTNAVTTGSSTNPGDSTASTTTGDDTTMGPDPTIGPPIFDVNMLPDSPKFDMGCRKVDFLFVIDNSGSMGDEQATLLANFDGFITAIQASLEETVDSYHVGVISSDAYNYNEPGCTSLGDLVTQTQSGGACGPFAEGGRFATEQDDLLAKFPCMALVGSSGSPIEQPVTGTIASFDPSKTGPGDCNEGFLRDDAILVVVMVTDDPPYNFDMDDAHPGTVTTDWYDDVLAAKNNDLEALVMIGFVPWMNVGCVGGAESPNLIGFIESFGDQGVLASVCEPDWSPIFADTVSTIVTTCENFDPPN